MYSISFSEEIKKQNPNQLRFREMVATRTNTPPIIDGLINDDIWFSVKQESDFIQFELKADISVLFNDLLKIL